MSRVVRLIEPACSWPAPLLRATIWAVEPVPMLLVAPAPAAEMAMALPVPE